MHVVWLISGRPAAGKTTTSKAFAKKFSKAAVISRDDLQDQIVSGNVQPDALPIEEAGFQIDMNVRNQCALAKSYLQHGFIPICDEVVGQYQLAIYKKLLKDNKIHLVTLNPTLDVAQKRDKLRSSESQFNVPVSLDLVQQDRMARWKILQESVLTLSGIGLWIDNSTMTIEETVSYRLKNKEKCIVK